MRLRGMRLALGVFAAQTVVGSTAALGWQMTRGGWSGWAALYGAAVAVAPGLFFAWSTLQHPADADPKRVVRSLYIGEAGKLALTISLFTGGVIWFGAEFLALLSTYAICLACYWLAMAVNR
ncbi:ATP synthase subunit I [Spectribacter hydrogenooxidans]|uniref:ATP synthase subunit I n=1 Tax=Spectribacter hydrogenoxidans TaxID=3075608 RepID=A0ABU3BZW8_9GAMM|nr:ATP synthase subunit I [Salinisphaera sp. W335]MDT0634858.1 ATP synthase subunit I [Salinisphaera sp. W335]